MIIRELILDDKEELGVNAISLVTDPAIEANFLFFDKEIQFRTVDLGNGYTLDLNEFWMYTAAPDPETIDNSREFCKFKAGHVHHISEIRGWDRYKSATFNGEPSTFIEQSNFFKNFAGVNSVSFSCDQQIYNCRHHLRRVRSINQIPKYKQLMYRKRTPLIPLFPISTTNLSKETPIQFEVNKEKREIVGPVLIPNKMIYRNDVNGKPGYVYLSAKTIRKIKEKYGFNRSLTIQHQDNITGRAILLDSWLHPEKDNFGLEVPNGTWFAKYKIIDEKLWNIIKEKSVLGFSIEALLNFKEPQK